LTLWTFGSNAGCFIINKGKYKKPAESTNFNKFDCAGFLN